MNETKKESPNMADDSITQALVKGLVKPLTWSGLGGEWDANTIAGTLTIKIDGQSGFYLFKGQEKATEFWSAVKDRSTPTDCMNQALLIVQYRILAALDLGKVSALVERAYLLGFNASAEGHNGEYPYQDNEASPTTDAYWIECRNRALAGLKGEKP